LGGPAGTDSSQVSPLQPPIIADIFAVRQQQCLFILSAVIRVLIPNGLDTTFTTPWLEDAALKPS